MKGLLVFFAVVALAQARSSGVFETREAAALGEYPFVVHLRVANFNSGRLSSCVGSLIGTRWVLTSSSCISNARFVWIRYGVVDVWKPTLVTEASLVTNQGDGLSLLNINRNVHSIDNIGPIGIAAEDDLPSDVTFCGFGSNGDLPGDTLRCFGIPIAPEETRLIKTSSDAPTEFDMGAPLFADNVLYGVQNEVGSFISVAGYRDWIQSVTGIDLSGSASEHQEISDDFTKVHFVNN